MDEFTKTEQYELIDDIWGTFVTTRQQLDEIATLSQQNHNVTDQLKASLAEYSR